MKKIYLALLAAALAVPIQTNAAKYEVTSIEFGQKYTTNLPPSTGKRSGAIAVSDGKIYTVEGPDDSNAYTKSQKMWVTQSNGSWKSFDLVDNGGRGITNDSEGNILYYHGANNYAGTFPAMAASGTLAVGDMRIGTLPAGSELGTDVYNASNVGMVAEIKNKDWTDGSVTAKDRADNVCAVGDIRNGECDLFFWPSATTSIVKITVKASATGITPTKTEIYTFDEASGLKKAADGRVMVKAAKINGVYHVLLHNSDCTSAYVGTLNASTKKVEGLTKMPYQSKNGTIVVSKKNPTDKQYYIYPSLTATWSGANKSVITKTQITVQNIITGETKTSTVSDAIETASYTTVSGNGLLLEAEFDESDDNLIHVYCYRPGVGAWTYDVTLVNTEAPDAPVAKIETVVNGSAKDAKISWNAVEGAASYTIEKSTDGKTGWSVLKSGMTELTYTDAGIQGVTSAFYRVKVVNGEGEESDYSNLVSVWPSFEPHNPTISLENYDGYSKVELTWSTLGEGNPSRATGFNVYRDGVLIAENIEVVHYLDQNVPEGNHIYYITSLYSDKPGIEGKSNEVETHVYKRNPANVRYELTEIYNYPVTNDAGNAFSNASNTGAMKYAYNQDAWRQGKLHKEADGTYWWYIAQLVTEETGQYESTYTEGSGGGVIRIKADPNPSAPMASTAPQLMANSAQRVLTFDANASTGLAMDSKGNIFVRQRTGYATTADDGETWTLDGLTYGKPSPYAFANSFHKARIYQRTGEASGTTPPTYNATYKPLDLEALGFYDPADEEKDAKGNWINKLGYRCDYYAATGDIYGGTGEVYLMPSSYTPATAVKLVMNNGSVSQIIKTVDTQGKMSGTESFFFPVLPNDSRRSDNIIQSRSNGYFNVPDDPASGSTTINFSLDDAIYATNSRINNAGGTTRWWNNDMFMITPEAMGSKNTGDFFIAKAIGNSPSLGLVEIDKPEDAVFSTETMIPIASWRQTDAVSKSEEVKNANALWIGTVPSEGAIGSTEAYMDIYIYSPGYRFAKYRLTPYIEIMNPETQINAWVAQNDKGTEIVEYAGKASWESIVYDGADYELKVYKVELYTKGSATPYKSFFVKHDQEIRDASGNLIGHTHVLCDALGNPVTSSDPELASIKTELRDDKGNVVTEGGTQVWNYIDLSQMSEGEHIINVQAFFQNPATGKENDTRNSEIATDVDNALYVPATPTGTVYVDREGIPFHKPVYNPTTDLMEHSKEWYVNYRVDINFTKVTAYNANKTTERLPVSHYEIYYSPTGDEATATQITEFDLLNMNPDGTTTKTRVTNGEIPGTYDFDNKGYAIPQGENNSVSESVLSFYVQPEVNVTATNPGPKDWTAIEGQPNPSQGKYYVRAVYAHETYIEQERQSGMETTLTETTSVNELVNLSARDYITPNVTSDYTVAHSTESITSIVIYNINGAVAAQIDGNGDCTQQVRVDDLASGIYFVTINGGKAHRMVKK